MQQNRAFLKRGIRDASACFEALALPFRHGTSLARTGSKLVALTRNVRSRERRPTHDQRHGLGWHFSPIAPIDGMSAAGGSGHAPLRQDAAFDPTGSGVCIAAIEDDSLLDDRTSDHEKQMAVQQARLQPWRR